MEIAHLNIKPIALYIPDTPSWQERAQRARVHFAEQNITDIYWLSGVHAQKWGLQGRHIFLLDGRPEEQHYVGDGNCGNFISQYAAFLVMDALNYTHYLYLEDDARFIKGWKPKLEQAITDAGDDWDFMFVGSCNARDKNPIHIKGDLYEFPYRGRDNWNCYPSCTHAYIINKRCVKHMINTNRDLANNTDTSMIFYSFPTMRVLAILPRLAVQEGNNLMD